MKSTTLRRCDAAIYAPIDNPRINALRQLVVLWFNGNQSAAARALGIDRALLWRYLTGRNPIGFAMLARMRQLDDNRREATRRALEALERHEREGAIMDWREEIRALPATPLRVEIQSRRLSNRRKKRAA